MNQETSVVAQISLLAIQLGVIIFAARFCGKAAQKFKIPPVLGELLAGIIIGPYLLGRVNLGILGFPDGLFPLPEGSSIPVSTPLYSIATLGSIILLFMSGLETDLRLLFRYSVAGTVVGIGGVIFSYALGLAFACWPWMSLYASTVDVPAFCARPLGRHYGQDSVGEKHGFSGGHDDSGGGGH